MLPEHSPLGKPSHAVITEYDPSLLYPIPRSQQRSTLPTQDHTWHGADRWHVYELSWLNSKGKPQVATMTLDLPASSPNIIESKSLKLYFNSLNQTRFDSHDQLLTTINSDLSTACEAPVSLSLTTSNHFKNQHSHLWPAANLDALDITVTDYHYKPELLTLDQQTEQTTEQLSSHLLKSNCLVTGQPDWGSIIIKYTGPPINHANLLRYLISFRTHNEFHEHCVERIFSDLMTHCQCAQLSVYAAYTRRGGLDICPFRSTNPDDPLPDYVHLRQ